LELPDHLLDIGLTPNSLYLIATLKRYENRWGTIELSIEQLSEFTKWSQATVKRELNTIKSLSLLIVTRKKRNGGKYHYNIYQLNLPQLTSEPLSSPELNCEPLTSSKTNSPEITSELSTVSFSTNIVTKQTSNNQLSTTYLIETSQGMKERIAMVNKWNEGDDDIAGVGLFEDEKLPAAQKINKRDSKTRHWRPQEDWSAADVATEYSLRLNKKIIGVPNLVSVARLTPILAKYRKQLGTNALLELKIMDMFFADERNIVALRKDVSKAIPFFLNSLKVDMIKAQDALKSTQVDSKRSSGYVYASDGTAFDDSMGGRKNLNKYEKELQEK
jgi:hypothetical protein